MVNIVPTLSEESLISSNCAVIMNLKSGSLTALKFDPHKCVLHRCYGETDVVQYIHC